MTETDRIAIIGSGHVGATSAFALTQSGVAREIVLVDEQPERAEGEAMDIGHAVPLMTPVLVRSGDYADAAGATIVVVAAGAAGRPGESRLDLLGRNVVVVRSIMERLMQAGFDGVLLMTTNPVDVLAQVAQEVSMLPVPRVIGSGTVLDTARLRAVLAEALTIDARSIHAHVIGEHGDSELAAWSCARVAGVPLADFCRGRDVPRFDEMLDSVRRAAPEIIERKGYTSYAIATCVAKICEAIMRDEHTVLPVSTLLAGQYGIDGVYLSLPCVVGRGGVERVMELPLDEAEITALRASADVLRRTKAQCA